MEKSVLMVPKETHDALKKYCADMHWPMVHAATVAINQYLDRLPVDDIPLTQEVPND